MGKQINQRPTWTWRKGQSEPRGQLAPSLTDLPKNIVHTAAHDSKQEYLIKNKYK